MGFCGDAVNLEIQLESLLKYQGVLLDIKKLEQQAQVLKANSANEALRERLLEKSTELSSFLSKWEALTRDRKRILEEQGLVSKRLDQDTSRLKTTAVPRDAISLQHEIDTLNRRAGILTEELAGIDAEIASQNEMHHRVEKEREDLERELELGRESVKLELEELRTKHAADRKLAEELRALLDESLLVEFDRLFSRGVAVGVLRKSMCGACNMTLTSTALNNLLATPKDSLLHCPECGAMLVRE